MATFRRSASQVELKLNTRQPLAVLAAASIRARATVICYRSTPRQDQSQCQTETSSHAIQDGEPPQPVCKHRSPASVPDSPSLLAGDAFSDARGDRQLEKLVLVRLRHQQNPQQQSNQQEQQPEHAPESESEQSAHHAAGNRQADADDHESAKHHD
jgi:hypothetical protein